MTREEQIDWLCRLRADLNNGVIFTPWNKEFTEVLNSVLEQEPCEDAISRQAVCDTTICDGISCNECSFNTCEDGQSGCLLKERISKLPPVTPQQKIGHCRDCKWQKDSDGVFRRGIDAESKCPMNRIEVFEGNGYCFLYEPKMQAESEE